MEALDRLANAAADFRQLLRAENEGGDAGYHHQLRHPKPEKALASQDPGPGPGPTRNPSTVVAPANLVGQRLAERG